MGKFIKKIVMVTMLISIVNVTFADRGAGKKSKVKTLLNINTTSSLKNSISANIKSGLVVYKGSLLASRQSTGSAIISSSLMTYQKGNTTYIIPYKNKISVAEMRQGYTGVKFIIRSHK